MMLPCRGRHAGSESRVPPVGTRGLTTSRLVSTWRGRKLLSHVCPWIAPHSRGTTCCTSSAVGIEFGLLLGVGKDVVGGLNDQELGVDFLFTARITVGVIFQSYRIQLARAANQVSARNLRTQFAVLLLDFRNVCTWRQLQVRVVIARGSHGP